MNPPKEKMDKSENTTAGNTTLGIVPMAKIDGGQVRKLRESRGLTQLYLATFIGVTTDTVSRWENRRYPAIKMENAEKLAEALEVELGAILEQECGKDETVAEPQEEKADEISSVELDQEQGQPDNSSLSVKSHQRAILPWLLLVLPVVIFFWLFYWATRPVPPVVPPGSVVAERILPKHIPPGQSFPVLIRIVSSQQPSVSFILRETIPSGCQVLSSEPSLVSVDAESGVLKWISRTDKQEAIFAYLVKVPVKSIDGDQLLFTGGVTLNQGDQVQVPIAGDRSIVVAPYHWADVDRNGKIDDEEILAVYDRYSSLLKLDFDRDLIDSIWTGNGYVWQRKEGKYVLEK